MEALSPSSFCTTGELKMVKLEPGPDLAGKFVEGVAEVTVAFILVEHFTDAIVFEQ